MSIVWLPFLTCWLFLKKKNIFFPKCQNAFGHFESGKTTQDINIQPIGLHEFAKQSKTKWIWKCALICQKLPLFCRTRYRVPWLQSIITVAKFWSVSQNTVVILLTLLFCETDWNSATTSCKNSGDTSPSWGVINFPIISHTAAPFPPLSVLLARQKNVGNLSSQHWKGERGEEVGKF